MKENPATSSRNFDTPQVDRNDYFRSMQRIANFVEKNGGGSQTANW